MTPQQTRLLVIEGDILDQPVQAIVNAARESLLGGGGIDAAIHYAANGWRLDDNTQDIATGELAKYCERTYAEIKGKPGVRCEIGNAVTTDSLLIFQRNPHIHTIIHTVGPRGNNPNREQLIRNAYTNSLLQAQQSDIRSVAFPAISAGNYLYDVADSAPIALQAINQFIERNPQAFDEIRIVVRPVDRSGKTKQSNYEVFTQNAQKFAPTYFVLPTQSQAPAQHQTPVQSQTHHKSFFEKNKKIIFFALGTVALTTATITCIYSAYKKFICKKNIEQKNENNTSQPSTPEKPHKPKKTSKSSKPSKH